MTISVRISVNGNYKCPVSYKQGDRDVSTVVSGRGHDGPNELYIPFSHGPDVLTLSVGPEEPDNSDVELPRGHHAALGMVEQDSGDNSPPPPHP